MRPVAISSSTLIGSVSIDSATNISAVSVVSERCFFVVGNAEAGTKAGSSFEASSRSSAKLVMAISAELVRCRLR